MLTEEETKKKLREAAQEFEAAVKCKDFMRAKAMYNKSLMVVTFMELGEETEDELFGKHGDDENRPDGLFKRSLVSRVDLECCMKRHKAYEDQACRRRNEPVRFYSDEDYCSRCVGEQ